MVLIIRNYIVTMQCQSGDRGRFSVYCSQIVLLRVGSHPTSESHQALGSTACYGAHEPTLSLQDSGAGPGDLREFILYSSYPCTLGAYNVIIYIR